MDKWTEVCNALSQESDSDSLIQLFAFLLWQIWKDRNAFTFNNMSKPAEESVSLAIRSRDDFREATSNHPLPSHQSEMDQQLLIHQSQLSWQPPPLGFVKLNFDAAWDKNSNSGATAIIVRDPFGSVIDWCCRSWVSISDPLQLESIACREALLFVKSRGFSHSIIEGDSLITVQACRGNPAPLNIQDIISDSLDIAKSFQSISFSWVRRTHNQVSHLLCKKFIRDSSFRVNPLY
ncbi:uncharacterized protein LOC110610464 [Manihot esculenta]|uniref:uncharacterized protein LOC110610464 n=1 Tax=Manihot esculenta TaxID=3983 RepID=UPI000B5D0B05|nr:uncharacterized protein LOC110610464 [Manihot esculenta]